MSVYTPAVLGLILRKNERTRAFIEREIERLSRRFPGADENLNEDEHLIGFSVAMSGGDLQSVIEDLEEQGAVYGIDFVATASADGVLGDVPAWLSEQSARVGRYKQLTKLYSLVSTTEALKQGA